MKSTADSQNRSTLPFATISRSPRRAFYGVVCLALFAALSVFIASERPARSQQRRAESAPISSEGSRNAIPRLSAFFGASGACLTESSRFQQPRNVGRSRLSRVVRSTQDGSSSDRKTSLRFSFDLFQPPFHASARLFGRLLREKTSPRPLWLFFLVLLN